MLRKLATIILCISSFVSASDSTKIASRYLMASSQRYNVTYKGNNDFEVNGRLVNPCDLDPSLRNVNPRQLNDLFKSNSSKLGVSRIGAGYALTRHEQLRGGGGGGAWLGSWLGYGGVMAGSKLITAGLTWGTALVCPPAAPFVAAISDTILTVVAQPVAITAGVAGGIALGTATGPI
ncbi:hypothetical protein JST99_01585 [Candidatus Dependentiae bacterium]|nr:hypothetical protein [Candidatus Dependentiae bacterium]